MMPQPVVVALHSAPYISCAIAWSRSRGAFVASPVTQKTASSAPILASIVVPGCGGATGVAGGVTVATAMASGTPAAAAAVAAA